MGIKANPGFKNSTAPGPRPLVLKFLDPPLGMTAQNPNKACLEALLLFSPQRVYIHLCGNDINIATTPKEIAENILDLVRYIKVNGVPDVMVGEILMRGGTFEKSPGMTKEIYKKMRNRVNTILRSKLGHC